MPFMVNYYGGVYTMDSVLLNYLTDDEKKTIAERVYEEELRKMIHDDISKRDSSIFCDASVVYTRVLNEYIRKMDLVREDFIPIFKKKVHDEMDYIMGRSKEEAKDMVTLDTVINWRLRDMGEEVVAESKDELKPIIREKVFKCCNETLLIAFLSDIVRTMNLNDAVKKLIQETEGDKT